MPLMLNSRRVDIVSHNSFEFEHSLIKGPQLVRQEKFQFDF